MTKSATEIYGSLIQSLYPQTMFEKWSNLRGSREWDYEYTSKKLKFSVKSEDYVEVLYHAIFIFGTNTRKNDCFLNIDTYSAGKMEPRNKFSNQSWAVQEKIAVFHRRDKKKQVGMYHIWGSY